MKYDNDWYNKLIKSPLNPPSWVFSLVWPILYILLGVSFVNVWINKDCFQYCKELNFFILQLILNLSWTTLFFKLKKLNLSLISLGCIIVFTIFTFFEFKKVSLVSSILLIPYLLWLCFAFYLNSYIILRNNV